MTLLTNPVFGVGLGITTCFGTLLLLYNALALFQHLRSEGDESASGLSKAAWALSVLGFFLLPCTFVFALVAIVLAFVERRRIYDERSSIASSLPVRMASMNGWVLLLLSVVLFVTVTLSTLSGS